MYLTLEVGHVPLGLKVYRPLPVLIVIVGEVMKMEQTLHLGLWHVWAPVWGGGKEEFVRTKMFLRLGGCGCFISSSGNLRATEISCSLVLMLCALRVATLSSNLFFVNT